MSQHDNLTQAIEKGLKCFYDIIFNPESINPGSTLDKITAEKALQKMKNLIDHEKNNFSEKTKLNVRYFYDFINEIVKGFMKKGMIPNSDNPSYFDKEYFIELDRSVNDIRESTFFPPIELYLPLNRSLYTTNDLTHLSDSSPYPKFYFSYLTLSI
ncbi:MAG: hypothetical protein HC820_09445 [Hydrococcus sp. RM1_1_31]|nr:hypothetical protein [Hydrococcus sp. RM1_1_31]